MTNQEINEFEESVERMGEYIATERKHRIKFPEMYDDIVVENEVRN